MPWLRLDDTFAEHRKIVALKRADRWTWVELLTYCARQTNGGRIPHGITDVLRWVTPAFLDQCTAIGLIDKQPDGTLTIHDWDDYNPLRIDDGELEQRVADALADHPEASANEVHRIVGGRKQAVLAIVKRFRPVPPQVPGTSTQPHPEPHPEPVPGTDREPVTRAAARARPVPTPPLEEQHQQQNGYLDAAAAAAAAEELATAGWSDTQIPADPDELYRALAWLRYAANDPTSRNPAGLAYSKFKSGTWAPLPAKPGRSV